MAVLPIGHIDVIPDQRICSPGGGGDPWKAGVIAVSKPGIGPSRRWGSGATGKVRFELECLTSGLTYSSTNGWAALAAPNAHIKFIDIATWAYNSRTQAWEYFCNIRGDQFNGNGTFRIRGIITDNVGRSRTTPWVNLKTNHFSGTGIQTPMTPIRQAYVLPGATGTPALEDITKPYQTIPAAISALVAANGGVADGCLVWMLGGIHNATTGNFTGGVIPMKPLSDFTGEWLWIKRHPSVAQDSCIWKNTTSGNFLVGNRMRIDGFRAETTANSLSCCIVQARDLTQVWADGIKYQGWLNFFGASPYVDQSVSTQFIGKNGNDDGSLYITNCIVSDTRYPWGVRNRRAIKISRHNSIIRCFQDAYVSQDFSYDTKVIHCTPKNAYGAVPTQANPTPEVPHADAWQGHSVAQDNVLHVNYMGRLFGYQGPFLRSYRAATPTVPAAEFTSENMAFVNFVTHCDNSSIATNQDDANAVPWSFTGLLKHLILWGCANLSVSTIFDNKQQIGFVKDGDTDSFQPEDVSVRGCIMPYFYCGNSAATQARMNAGNTWQNEVCFNHYADSVANYGSDPGHSYNPPAGNRNFSYSPDTVGGTCTHGKQNGTRYYGNFDAQGFLVYADAVINCDPNSTLFASPQGTVLSARAVDYIPDVPFDIRGFVRQEYWADGVGEGTVGPWAANGMAPEVVAPVIVSAPVTTAQQSSLYSYQAIAQTSGLTATWSFDTTAFPVPAGMTISSNGLVQWTPPDQTSVTISIKVTTSAGVDHQEYTITISPPLGQTAEFADLCAHAYDFAAEV